MHEDETADPREKARDHGDAVLERAVEPLGEAEKREHRDHSAQLQRDDAVDRTAAEGNDAEREEAADERGRRDLERVQAGDSDLRRRTRSCSVTCSSSMSMT